MLSLSYYTNQIGVHFAYESILIVSVLLIMKQTKKESVSLEEIFEVSTTIKDLFKNEFLPKA